LSFYGKWQESIDECHRYLALPDATWNRERCYAYRVIGRCYKELGNMREAEKSFHMAALESPDTREPWCELATLCYIEKRWPECFAYAMRALQITIRENVYTADPIVWGYQPHDLAAIAAWNIGLKDIAVREGKLALDLEPNDDRLKLNLQFYMSDDNVVQPAIAAE
jgi:tetratricopeptide (TPR) repeat protein